MVFGDVINFFEAIPSHADKHLTQPWKVMADIKQLSGKILLDNQPVHEHNLTFLEFLSLAQINMFI